LASVAAIPNPIAPRPTTPTRVFLSIDHPLMLRSIDARVGRVGDRR
jgi:hypothetical protein